MLLKARLQEIEVSLATHLGAPSVHAALREMLADGGEHYSHYDLLVGRNAPAKVFPAISAFLEGEEEDAAEDAEEGEASEPSAMRRLLVGTLRTLFAWEP